MRRSSQRLLRHWAPSFVAALFLGSGTLHLVRPDTFNSLVPSGMPASDVVVLVSGVAELICGAGLLARAGWAGPASALLLVAIFPGNLVFALDTAADGTAPPLLVVAAWARLPLQVPLIWAALQARRDDASDPGAPA